MIGHTQSRPTRRSKTTLILALAAMAPFCAAQEDDQRLILEDEDIRSMYYDASELESKTGALAEIESQLDSVRRNAQELDRQARDQLFYLRQTRAKLGQSLSGAQLAEQTIEANQDRIAELKSLRQRSRVIQDDAAQALRRRLANLYLAKLTYGDSPADFGDQTGPIHAITWRAAARHAAYVMDYASEAIQRADEELERVQAVVRRQQTVSEQKTTESNRLQSDIAKASGTLQQIEDRRLASNSSIASLNNRRQGLADLILHLREQKQDYEDSRVSSTADNSQGDQGLVIPEPGGGPNAAPPTATRPLSAPDGPAGESSPGFEVETGEPAAIHLAVAGEVLSAGELSGYDHVVVVGHDEDYYTIYAYLSRVFVQKGDQVNAGEILGLSGHMLLVNGKNGARFEVYRGGTKIPPLSWPQTPRDLKQALLR